MESASRPFTFNIFEKAKSFFYHLRWIFCFSTPEENNNNNQNKRNNKLSKTIKIKSKNSEAFKGKDGYLKRGLSVIFNDLPEECLLLIFSHLSMQQKGTASMVCTDWNSVLKSHPLWAHIDLTLFKLVCQCNKQPSYQQNTAYPCSNLYCYNLYKTRMKKFINFLLKYQFRVKSLKFSFDIIDCDDSWDVIVQSMWKNMNLRAMAKLDLNWLETPEKTQRLTVEWGAQIKDLQLLQRRRTRKFESIFPLISASSPHLESLKIPFDWTDTCVKHLCQMQTLKSLTLTNCSNKFSNPSPQHLDCILKSLHRLQHLEVYIDHDSHSLHHTLWSLRSESLRTFRLFSENSYPTFNEVHLPNCSEVSFQVLPAGR